MIKRTIITAILAITIGAINANDSLFVPYKLNYLPAGSPEWMIQLANPEGLDYNAMVDSFNVYLQNTPGARRKSRDTKQVVNHFRRFQQAYLPFVKRDGKIKLPTARLYHSDIDKVNKEVIQSRLLPQSVKDLSQENGSIEPWRVISPMVTYDYITKKVSPAQSNIQRLAASRSNPNILYCGSETGMVFRSSDKGESWQPCNGGEWMAGEITFVEISSSNPNRVLVGGGGVCWLTNDGGDTWQNITPEKTKYARSSTAQFHPENDNVILFGDRAQLWRSTDGGASWDWMLDGMVFDVKFSRQNPQVCYVAIEQESDVKLYKSTDGGSSWDILQLGGDPLISARIGLSEAPNGADYVYLWACRRNHLSKPGPLFFSGPPLLFKSTNGGESFIVIDPVDQMENVDSNGGQGYYDLVCTASATDPEELLVGIIQLYRSTDGGQTIQNMGGYYGKFDLHCDMQSIQTNGAGDTWLSTDGGVIYSNDFFENHAEAKIQGLYSSEMWGFDQGWNEDVMVGGRNHNGNMSQLDRYNGVAISMHGSERPTGYVFLSNPRKVAFSDSENVLMPDDWRDEFVPFLDFWTYPMESSQYGMGFEFDPRYAQCFYVIQGSYDGDYRTLWRTTDDGASFTEIHTFENPISAMAVSRSNPNKIVVGTWGRLYQSLDAGATFEEYILPDEMINSIKYKIAINPVDENEIWCSDGNPGGLWRTKDNCVSWEKLDKGLTIASWEGNMEPHSVGRFFLTGNDKNAAYAIAYTYGYLNETYSTTRGKVLYRDDTTDGWIDYSDGLQKVMNLNRMIPFYKDGVIRLATNNGIWQRSLVDNEFIPIAQPIILNAGSGDNTQSTYPVQIQLDSYSIVNQTNAQWKWNINPAPLSITSYDVRNPIITIQPNQTYDISLTITTPAGSNTKTIHGMIKGNNPVPNASVIESEFNGKDLLLVSGNVVYSGESFIFESRNLIGMVQLTVYASNGSVVYDEKDTYKFDVATDGLASDVYFYMATDEDGFRKTGKLLVK